MSKLERMIRTYYCRVIFTKESLKFGEWSLLFLAFMVTIMFGFSFSDKFQLWFFIISVAGCIVLSVLNYVGERLFEQNTRFNWLLIPYISGIFATIVVWVVFILNPHNYETTRLSRQFLIYFPIVFPILTLVLQYSLFDIYTEREPKKDLLLKIPVVYIGALPFIIFTIIFLVADLFKIDGIRTPDYAIGSAMALTILAVSTLFTATSEYWHPELKQSRYDEAMGALQQTKKSKKTGKKKKKMKLKNR
ncbi:hypothetical protein [Streptococcus gallolyticus]|uniref:hypothetical protein n=1 Tax=Streptococcus gallolyticus TaxID=315405 RepID=UPI00088338D4|nr:hypothetical protein [Streptococcus gallolyticus]SDK38084.1 hypothetical protein SAMN04487842_0064 [Streptococcus gallolyticus]SDL87130.1 hypothetical protein SAMN04487841_0066 [Streptococcus gallolyticus]